MNATTSKADPIQNRAPKGGAISLVNGRFYLGGQFMPVVPSHRVEAISKPAPLTGSTRQVLWAARLRREALIRIQEEIHARRLFLTTPTRQTNVKATRESLKTFMASQYELMIERSAASVIDKRFELV